jgi:cation:H+ antiporter
MDALPLWQNAALFVLASAVIWWAGTRLERDADVISRRTGLGSAFTGMLLLAGATSLPVVATTVTAVGILGNPTLGVYNLLGGVALQTGILAVADAFTRKRGALTFFTPRFVLLIEGIGLLVLLQLAVAGIATRGLPTVFSISVWLIALALAYVGVMYLVYRYRGQARWTPTRADDSPDEELADTSPSSTDERSTRAVWSAFVAMSLLVLIGGWLAAQTADVLAEQTGLGSAFLGATLLAAATSLPELSTTIAAVRSDRYTVAVSNVFGSNAFDVALLFLAELLYRDGTILEGVEMSVVFVATIGMLMTCIYLWGLMERENRTVLRVGWDSAAISLVYVGGMTVLYFTQ